MVCNKQVLADLRMSLNRMEILAFTVGPSRRGFKSIVGIVTSIVWLVSLTVNFICSIVESFNKYGYTSVATQCIWLLAFLLSTIFTKIKTLPWLRAGLLELKCDGNLNVALKNALHSIKVSQ